MKNRSRTMMNTVLRVSLLTLSVLIIGSATDIASAQTYLQNGNRYYRSLNTGQWSHFTVNVSGTDSEAEFLLTSLSGNPDIYVRQGEEPTLDEWDFRPFLTPARLATSFSIRENSERVSVGSDSNPAIQNGRYFISIHARTRTLFLSLIHI